MSDEGWICQCPALEHGLLGCVRGTSDDEGLCLLCQDGIHDEDDE